MTIKDSIFDAENNDNVRHIIALSGGKDSSALAVHMKDRLPNIEYVFCDTGEELDETYEYIAKLQEYLRKDIQVLSTERNFQFYLDSFHGVLPDARTRWCTRLLKLKPYEDFIGDTPVVSYVGLRADEPQRTGYLSSKPNIKTTFPFREENIRRADVIRILEEKGLGLPKYYEWRSRSGCYFCFFQQRIEWVGLLERHPDLFEKAKAYEKFNNETGQRFTWAEGESLEELSNPKRIKQIKIEFKERQKRKQKAFKQNQKLADMWSNIDDEAEDLSCNFCHL